MNPTNRRCRLARTIFGLAALLLGTLILPAATLTVSQLGGGAYTNIQDALNAALPGDTVLVEHGEYKESLSITKNVTIKGADPRYTLIRPASGHGITIDNNVTARIKAVWITAVDGDGIRMASGDDIRVENCIISSCGGCGINYPGNNVAATLFLANCTIAANTSRAVSFIGPSSSPPSATWLRNIFYQNGTGPYSYYDGSTAHNCVNESVRFTLGPGDITSNPLFVDPAAQNFLLRTGSPCIDTGTPDPVYNDPDGTRNDMGAFGGPGAAEFWPYPPGGPFITDLQLREGKVTQGAKLKIHAVGKVR